MLLVFSGCEFPATEGPAGAVDDGPAVNNEDPTTGTLVLSFSPAGLLVAKTIEPDIGMDIETYDVHGAGPGGASFDQTGLTSSSVVQASLVPGGGALPFRARTQTG